MSSHVSTSKAINAAVLRYSSHVEPHLISYFKKVDIAYPPRDIALLAFKKEQYIQLWAQDKQQDWHFVRTYPLTAFSGKLGPKLKEHDRQIPEGIYRLTSFNPFSAWHLSMMINYPNDFDQLHAHQDGRRKLGGDIFLHGKSKSVGCLAVGDDAIDELFILSRRVGLDHIQLIIAPNDLRTGKPATNQEAQPRWLPELYRKIAKALKHFPVPKQPSNSSQDLLASSNLQPQASASVTSTL
ncbi:MAG: L,D-transpeptidase family protein [Gammaproteobacteria bacterium]|nr:L,D-transpeptidase family protein [Gammaproteobacteria bacterium]